MLEYNQDKESLIRRRLLIFQNTMVAIKAQPTKHLENVD